jgi:flavorubredoxin
MQPFPPTVHRAPQQVAKDTFIIQSTLGEGVAPIAVNVNSMVIRGAEPIVIDTGGRNNRANWLTDVFSLVDPEDIRWITISHDDVDHTGNLDVLLEMAPNATFVSSWFINERMSVELAVPPTRMRWMTDGETLGIGDRTLSLVRPPVYDSPTTRGFFDPTTGVYWAADAFATPMQTYVDNVSSLDPEFWGYGFTMFGQSLTPWLPMVDNARFQSTVDRIAALQPTTIVGCHTPIISRTHVDQAITMTRALPSMPEIPLPGQETLDQMLAATAIAA